VTRVLILTITTVRSRFSDIKHRKIKWLPIEIRVGLDARPVRGAAAMSF
jgi:hypothetical protein